MQVYVLYAGHGKPAMITPKAISRKSEVQYLWLKGLSFFFNNNTKSEVEGRWQEKTSHQLNQIVIKYPLYTA